MISMPAALASGCAETTIAFGAVTGDERTVQVAGIERVPRMTAARAAPAVGEVVPGPAAPPQAATMNGTAARVHRRGWRIRQE
jgi:hypothetical protein